MGPSLSLQGLQPSLHHRTLPVLVYLHMHSSCRRVQIPLAEATAPPPSPGAHLRHRQAVHAACAQ
eukprot:14009892-Alexandrium_andersonii.AAC.1